VADMTMPGRCLLMLGKKIRRSKPEARAGTSPFSARPQDAAQRGVEHGVGRQQHEVMGQECSEEPDRHPWRRRNVAEEVHNITDYREANQHAE
jgi:hypothetical protein